jgi:hypothetical protein
VGATRSRMRSVRVVVEELLLAVLALVAVPTVLLVLVAAAIPYHFKFSLQQFSSYVCK